MTKKLIQIHEAQFQSWVESVKIIQKIMNGLYMKKRKLRRELDLAKKKIAPATNAGRSGLKRKKKDD